MREKFVALLLATVVSSPAVSESPNIVILLADDLGWTGTSVQMDERVPGSKSDLYRTPNHGGSLAGVLANEGVGEVARRLSRMLDDYLASVDLELPTPNPEYDPTRDTGLISVGGNGSP